jgi:hypothetical protein
MAAAACTGPTDGARRSTSDPRSGATAPTVEETTPTSSTTTAPVMTGPADQLPPCGARTSYRTTASWSPEHVPEGFELEHAHDTVNLQAEQPGGEPHGVGEFVLVDVRSGVYHAGLRVSRWSTDGFELDPGRMAGHVTIDRIDGVRGQAGNVERVVNRGDAWGHSVARWIEYDVGWVASSAELQPPELADVLASLSISAEAVSDPAGRFEVVGRRSNAPMGALRETELGFGLHGRPSTSSPPLTVTITEQPEGSSGLVGRLPGAPPAPGAIETAVSELDGRAVLFSFGATLTSLPDGSSVIVQTSAPPGLDEDGRLVPNPTDITPEQVRELISGLVRVELDDPRLSEVSLTPPWWSGYPDGFCREER